MCVYLMVFTQCGLSQLHTYIHVWSFSAIGVSSYIQITALNSLFSYSLTGCLTKVKEPSLSYYSSMPGGRIVGYISFARALALFKIQTSLFRIWTWVVKSISYNNNPYTSSTFIFEYWTYSVQHSAWNINHLYTKGWECDTTCG